MKAHTLETQTTVTPEKALNFLKEGNQRFVNNLKANRDLLEQVNATRAGQWPFAVVLSCIDSRTSAELILDQGLGDVFSIRIAGNFVNQDILGSMEFGCTVAGSKLVVVLGHSKCGALKGGLDSAQIEDLGMDNLNHLIGHFNPIINEIIEDGDLPRGLVGAANFECTHTPNINREARLVLCTQCLVLWGWPRSKAVGRKYRRESGSLPAQKEHVS